MKKIIAGIISGIVAAYVTLLVACIIFDVLFEVFGITIFLCAVLAIGVGIYCAKKETSIFGCIEKAFKRTIIYAVILCIVMIIIGGVIEDDYNPSYSGNGLTQQEKDNLEFYNQMENAWNDYRDDYN